MYTCLVFLLELISHLFLLQVLIHFFFQIKILKIDEEKNISRVEITIHEGKNRQVRKMCETLGYSVLALHRSKIGEIFSQPSG